MFDEGYPIWQTLLELQYHVLTISLQHYGCLAYSGIFCFLELKNTIILLCLDILIAPEIYHFHMKLETCNMLLPTEKKKEKESYCVQNEFYFM